MNRIRYLAAGLLCLTGIIHAALLGIPKSDATFATMAVIFGAAYLIIGGFLFRNNKTAYYLGQIVPSISFCGGMVKVLPNPTIWMAFLMAIDAVIVISCFYLIRGGGVQKEHGNPDPPCKLGRPLNTGLYFLSSRNHRGRRLD
jgi:uncharacterized membrane protein (DUF2068 family)